MKNVYLIFAIVGAAVPYFFFMQHFASDGLALSAFLGAAFVNPAASGFAADLFISSFVFWAYMFQAGGEAPKAWPFIALNLLIGLSCALPAYLYWRARGVVPATV
jgi:hypothetical protein